MPVLRRKNACTTKSLFLCAPRRFFASVGQTIGFRRLPCLGQNPQKNRRSSPFVFAAKPPCATTQKNSHRRLCAGFRRDTNGHGRLCAGFCHNTTTLATDTCVPGFVAQHIRACVVCLLSHRHSYLRPGAHSLPLQLALHHIREKIHITDGAVDMRRDP